MTITTLTKITTLMKITTLTTDIDDRHNNSYAISQMISFLWNAPLEIYYKG